MFKTLPVVRGFKEVESLFALLSGRGTICGGYARFCASPTLSPPKADDVDVYCHTVEDYETLVNDLKQELSVRLETNRAVTFNPTTEGRLAFVPTVQLIKPVTKFRMVCVGSPSEIIDNFDFTIVRAALTGPTEVLVDERFEADEKAKRLRLINIHCPISSTLRCTKYVARGYSLYPWDCLRLFLDWDSRDASYRESLVEGLDELQAAYGGGKALEKDRLTALYDLINVD